MPQKLQRGDWYFTIQALDIQYKPQLLGDGDARLLKLEIRIATTVCQG